METPMSETETDKITVKAITSDFKNSRYLSPTDCPLARALKRQFNTENVRVSGFEAFVDDKEFMIPNAMGWLRTALDGKFAAAEGKEFSVDLELIKR